ncbi:hypothetical protein EGW08_016742 [Elysia chlorotica]|uniref:Uncharacterized protein n=1 Tax=Elysia chlorotica TaxID=188477 RepID=A0A3S1B5K4_ELYCH|nr:hypothetical protein EGW08_016742 [Elysia chlorotica]
MVKIPRKRKTVCIALGVFLLTLTLLITQSLVREAAPIITANLALPDQDFRLHIDSERSDNAASHPAGEAAAANQLPYIGHVISDDNVTFRAGTCTPVTNVAFVKTHKAGSSTVANILQRFGISHNLTFALPNNKIHTYGYNYISKGGQILTPARIIPLGNGSHHGYNILFNHAIYNRTAFRMIMPEDTHYISILREPFSQFVSAFEYYNAKKSFSYKDKSILKAGNPISSYLKNPFKYEKRLYYFSYVKNKQAEDLGMSWHEYFMPAKLSTYLETLRADFTLVMIMEYFDESLILLKRKLCWDFKDILYIPKNKNENKPQRNFTELDHRRHERLSHLDYKLYGYFLKAFLAELKAQSRDFWEELAHFKEILVEVHSSCQKDTLFYTEESRWHAPFTLDREDCRLMQISELAALDLLLERSGVLDWKSKGRAKDERRVPDAVVGLDGVGLGQAVVQGHNIAKVESGIKIRLDDIGIERGLVDEIA